MANSLVQIVKMVDDDLSAESYKFLLASQLCSFPSYGVIWLLSSYQSYVIELWW